MRLRTTDRVSLTEPQWDIYRAGWDQEARFRVAVCGRRFGKALAVSTRLPSPDGWTTMGDVRPGDRLYDERGLVCTVVFTSEVMLGRPCNRLVFNDASALIADDEHLWPVNEMGTNSTRPLIRSTRQIAERLAHVGNRGCSIVSCKPLHLPEYYFPEDPYRLGLLADRRGSFRIEEGNIRGSIAQRRRILSGVVAAARANRGCGNYHVACRLPQFARLLAELVVSLGYVAHTERLAVHWSTRTVAAMRRIVAVEPVTSVAVRCIQVDSPSRLYLCGNNHIPTHNTFLMAEELRRAVRFAVRQNIGTENEVWYGAPTFIQAKRVMWGRLKKAIPAQWLIQRPNETTCSMRLRSGHVIRIVGLDAFENLRGSGLWFFGGDEWADCRPEAWAEVIRPMLSTSRGHALFIGTPKGFDHFRDAYMLGQPGGDPEYRSFLFTTLDGGNVPPQELEAARRQLDPRVFRQEYGASFESYAGRVIYAFSRADNVKSCRHDSARPLHVGMDFNINPMTATIWQEDGTIACQIGEIILPTSNTDEMVIELRRRYGRTGYDPTFAAVDHITVYPDPAGAQRRSSAGGRTDIGILRAAGLSVCVQSSHPSVRDRTNVMNRQFLAADGSCCAFVDPGCVKSIEAYERLVYREGTNEPDKGSGHDHLVDATGYYLYGRSQRLRMPDISKHSMER